MSIKNLTANNFSLEGRTMKCNVPGIAFVMFKTEQCQFCKNAIPILQQLAQAESRVMFAVTDVGKHRQIVALAKESTFPLRAVPVFLLYHNGRPHINYDGKKTVQDIMAFFAQIIPTLNPAKPFVQKPQRPEGNQQSQQSQVYAPQTEGVSNTLKIDSRDIAMPPKLRSKNEPWKVTT